MVVEHLQQVAPPPRTPKVSGEEFMNSVQTKSKTILSEAPKRRPISLANCTMSEELIRVALRILACLTLHFQQPESSDVERLREAVAEGSGAGRWTRLRRTSSNANYGSEG